MYTRRCTSSTALLAPIIPYRKAVNDNGIDLALLAAMFMSSQTTVALRLGEALGYGVALVGGIWVPRRGPLVLPRDPILRLWVCQAEDGVWLPGVRMYPVTDQEPGITAVVVDDW